MLKGLALTVYTFMTMMLYESSKYKTDSNRRKRALAALQLITLIIMVVMAIYLISY